MGDETKRKRSSIGTKIIVIFFIIVFLVGISMSLPIQTKLRQILKMEGLREEVIDNIVNSFTIPTLLYVSVGICMAMLVGYALSRTITKPIQKLREGVERIGAKDWDYRVDIKTGDEIEELSEAFNEMAADLKRHIEDLRRTTAEKERIEKELEIARQIQESFLPRSCPQIGGIELSAVALPARQVGGDFYDFIPLDQGRWGFVVADVSDKGVPGALFMALSRSLIRAHATRAGAEEAIEKANYSIISSSESDMFVTLFYALLDSARKDLTYINAGHNPPILLRNTGELVMLRAKGMALGVIEDLTLEEKRLFLREGDTIVFYTDGVIEAINDREEQFGMERFIKVIQENKELPPQELITKVIEEVRAFTGDEPQFDDITLMAMKFK
jgi:sigma-B regulation protein RsbU (phosphoserine phosphatase)